ncbi:MAG: hypothetical protein ACXVQQ_08250 [Gaiellaceae bacterium]
MARRIGWRRVAAVMRTVGKTLGKHVGGCLLVVREPCRRGEYLEDRTLDDFRPRHLRVVGAPDTGLDPEELATSSLLRSRRIRAARAAA